MECVEIVPHRQAAGSGKENSGQQQRSGLDDHLSEITPERPFVPRLTRELQEKDEIGKPLSRILKIKNITWN